MEHTKVIVAVYAKHPSLFFSFPPHHLLFSYGPRHNPKNEFSEKGRVECSFKWAPFACPQRKKPQPDEEEEDLSLQLTRALSMCVRLEKYPKSTVDVYCLVLQDDGGAFAAAICAGSLALADAGIECFDLVASCQAVLEFCDKKTKLLSNNDFFFFFCFATDIHNTKHIVRSIA